LTLNSIMPFFAVGVAWTYLLAFSAIGPVIDLLTPAFWRIVRNIGLEYLALVFFIDLVLGPIGSHPRHPLLYLPFSVLIGLGLVFRLTATLRGSGHLWLLLRSRATMRQSS
jgi:hypothetical protein